MDPHETKTSRKPPDTTDHPRRETINVVLQPLCVSLLQAGRESGTGVSDLITMPSSARASRPAQPIKSARPLAPPDSSVRIIRHCHRPMKRVNVDGDPSFPETPAASLWQARQFLSRGYRPGICQGSALQQTRDAVEAGLEVGQTRGKRKSHVTRCAESITAHQRHVGVFQ